jgi:hypothetical protein
MNVDRLLRLAEFLERLNPALFRIAGWTNGVERGVSAINGGKLRLKAGITEDDVNETACGFAACAVGWACTLPDFQADGLYYNVLDGYPVHGQFENWEAVEAFFGLEPQQAWHLFSLSDYQEAGKDWREEVPPDEVAKRIRDMIGE